MENPRTLLEVKERITFLRQAEQTSRISSDTEEANEILREIEQLDTKLSEIELEFAHSKKNNSSAEKQKIGDEALVRIRENLEN